MSFNLSKIISHEYMDKYENVLRDNRERENIVKS